MPPLFRGLIDAITVADGGDEEFVDNPIDLRLKYIDLHQ
jgi:hypothetical protein